MWGNTIAARRCWRGYWADSVVLQLAMNFVYHEIIAEAEPPCRISVGPNMHSA